MSPTATGEDLISDCVLNVHSGLPSATLTACTTPTRSPTNTRPLATAGDDSPIASPALYRQRSLPSASPTAINSPVAVPTYTTPSTIAADESNASPPSHTHANFGAGAIVVEET